MTHRIGRAVLLGAVLLAFAACGGDDDSDASDDADQDEQTGGTDAAADDGGSTDTTTSDDAGQPEDPSLPPTIDVGGLEGFCRQAVEARNAIIGLQGSETAPTDAPDLYAAAYDILAEVEPPETLVEDWAAVTALVQAAADALADIDVTDQDAVDEAFAGAELTELGADAAEASDRIDNYLRDECGVELG